MHGSTANFSWHSRADIVLVALIIIFKRNVVKSHLVQPVLKSKELSGMENWMQGSWQVININYIREMNVTVVSEWMSETHAGCSAGKW